MSGLLLDLLPSDPWVPPRPPPRPPGLEAVNSDDALVVVLCVLTILAFAWAAAWVHSRISDGELEELDELDDEEE